MTGFQADFDLTGKRIWVAGHLGMVGRAIIRRLAVEQCKILTTPRTEIDLRRQADVEDWVGTHKPDAIFMAAATVGGILANDTRPAEFLYDNLAIEANIIHAAYRASTQKLLFLGSSCIYPQLASQPMREDALLTGPLEPTNQWYAVAKIAGIMMCRAYRRQYGCNFISAMPTNLYGPNDNFDLLSSHVIPALMAKAHAAKISSAKEVVVWGTGSPRREFMYVDDLADALVFLMRHYSDEQHVNIGVGYDMTIRELARLVIQTVQFDGALSWDSSKKDGTPRKLMDSTFLLDLGWKPSTRIETGLDETYKWYRESLEAPSGVMLELGDAISGVSRVPDQAARSVG